MSLITFPFRLDALGKTPKDREQVRRYFWELMTQQHTPLINRLNLLVAEHRNFAKWQINNTVDADDLKCLWRSLKKQPQFQGIPERTLVSARLVTHNTYESWLALQADRQEKLTKLLNSVEVLKPDAELIAIGSCNLDVIRNRAKEVLSEVNTQVSNDSKKKKSQKAIEGGIYKILYDKHHKTDDLLEKCAIAYLIKNRFKITSDETEEDVKKLNDRRHSKQKEIEILQKQLHSRLPKGRPWAGRDIFDEIASIGIIEDETEWNSIESALLKQQAFMPHPILFESSDDLIWAEPEKFQLKDLQVEADKSGSTELDKFQNEDFQSEQANSVESRKRVCVGFKSFEEKYAFEVAGDYRHIHTVWQALKERKIYDKNTHENTSALFLVRSATLIWREYKKNENRIVRRRKANNKRSKREGGTAGTKPDILRAPEFYDPEFPWNRYQLFLHCTIETLYVSKEGTELKLEMQKKPIAKSLQTLEKKIAESEEKGESTKTRKDRHSRQSGTLRRIECYDDNYKRPSKSLYTGQPHIVTGVAFGASGLVTVTILDTSSGKILECRGRKALLGKQDNRLVNRRQFQRQLNMRRRTQNQRRGANNQFGEANLGDTIDRHIANAVVDFAKAYQSGCIVLPDMEDYRRRKQSEIAALAERECSGWKGVEKKFAKAQNVKIHSWSYGRSIEYITNQAEQEGMLVKIGRQPIHGSSQEQAKQMAIEVYQAKTKSKQSLSNQSA